MKKRRLGKILDKEFWEPMPEENKREFESKYGSYVHMSFSDKNTYLASYFHWYEKKENEKIVRDTIKEVLEDKFSEYVNNVDQKIIDLKEDAFKVILDKIDEKGTQVISKSSDSLDTHVNQIQAPQTQIYAPSSTVMDCQYKSDGPKNCITVETTKDGVYGICRKATEIKRRARVPLMFTTALDFVGCPSQTINTPFSSRCDYLDHKRVKI